MTGFIKKKPTMLQLEQRHKRALKTLQLEAPVTVEEVSTQFRLLCKQGHPDTSTLDHPAEHAPSLNELRKAKDFLIKDLELHNV